MDKNEKAEFVIEILAPQSTNEQLDQMTRQLLVELRDLHIDSISLLQGGPAPEGAKSLDAITIGAIALTVLPTLLPKIVEVAQAWVLRGSNRSIKFKGKIGKQMIEFEGPPEELTKLLDNISKRK